MTGPKKGPELSLSYAPWRHRALGLTSRGREEVLRYLSDSIGWMVAGNRVQVLCPYLWVVHLGTPVGKRARRLGCGRHLWSRLRMQVQVRMRVRVRVRT